MSNAYDKLDRRLKDEDANAPPPSHASADRPDQSQVPQRRGYITHREGYVPARPVLPEHRPQPQPQPDRQPSRPPTSPIAHPPTDDRNHPLHLHYRKRIRGIRTRWFGSGIILRGIFGILLTLLASALVVTKFAAIFQSFTGEPDIAVVIGENYLNRQAAARLQNGAPMTAGPLKLTALTLDLKPNNRMDLHPQFSADLMLTTLNFGASVQNELTVQDGQLVITMVGDPQLGDLNVPLDLLPFNIKDSTRQSVNQIDNDLLAAEINRAIQNASSSTNSTVEGITTTETSLTIRLKQK